MEKSVSTVLRDLADLLSDQCECLPGANTRGAGGRGSIGDYTSHLHGFICCDERKALHGIRLLSLSKYNRQVCSVLSEDSDRETV